MRILLLAVISSLLGYAQQPELVYKLPANSVVVKTTQYGNFEFVNISIADRIEPYDICMVAGDINNKTDGSWTENEFSIELLSAKNGESVSVIVAVDNIPFGATRTHFSAYCYGAKQSTRHLPFEPVSYLITFGGGYREPGPEAAKKETAAARLKADAALKARRNKEVAVAKARADYLAKFPIVESGFTSAFVGSDKKCSAEFLEAAAMEGLEKRKRLADLVAFGCGFITSNGAHATVIVKDGKFALVKMIDGDKQGQSGWVPVGWLK